MVAQLRTIIPHSMTSGTNPKAACTSTCTVSSPVLTLLSNTLPSGLLCSFSSLVVSFRNVCTKLTSHSLRSPSSLADPQLISNIRSSNILIPNIRQLATTRTSTPASSIGGTPRSHHSQRSYQDTETGEGQGEIQLLARRILDFTDGEGDGAITPNAPASQMQAGSLIESRAESVMGRDHEELRRSVREAFSGGSGTH